MSKMFNSDDDDFGYLDDSIHINWKKLLPAIIIVAAALIALIIVLIVSFGHRAVSYTHLDVYKRQAIASV